MNSRISLQKNLNQQNFVELIMKLLSISLLALLFTSFTAFSSPSNGKVTKQLSKNLYEVYLDTNAKIGDEVYFYEKKCKTTGINNLEVGNNCKLEKKGLGNISAQYGPLFYVKTKDSKTIKKGNIVKFH